MRKIDIEFVQIGSILARDIYNSRGDLLLSKNTILTNEYIENMKRHKFTSVYINDGLIDDVVISDVISKETRLQAINCLRLISNNFQSNKIVKIPLAKNVIANMIDDLINNKEMILNLSDIRSYDDYTFNHSVNVTVISIIIGMCLNYDKEKLLDLGLGVLLHDIGKTQIPYEILNKPDKLTPEEFEVVKQHTWHGFEILRNNPEIKLTSAHIALQHHERFDGSGYPRGLKGKNILESARINAIADVYDALSNDRCYRKKLPVHQVYQILREGSEKHFDSEILDVFLKKIALYPNGTKIILNDGRMGFVIKQDYTKPSRPRVRLFWNNENKMNKPEEIELSNYPNLAIVDVIER